MSLNSLPEMLFSGPLEHEWSCLGIPIVYTLFASGVIEDVKVRTSGLDTDSKTYVQDTLYVAHAISSVNRVTFDGKFEDKLKYVRSLHPPIRDLHVQEYYAARAKQTKSIAEKQEELKKSTPNQS